MLCKLLLLEFRVLFTWGIMYNYLFLLKMTSIQTLDKSPYKVDKIKYILSHITSEKLLYILYKIIFYIFLNV